MKPEIPALVQTLVWQLPVVASQAGYKVYHVGNSHTDTIRNGLKPLATDRITDNNEGDLTGPAPQVAPPREEAIPLGSGARLQTPPHSLTAMRWEVA